MHGEWITGEGGRLEHRYPSYRDLGARFGVTKTVIHRFAKRHNCLERRAGSGAEPEPQGAPSSKPAPAAPPSEDADASAGAPPRAEDGDEPMLPTVREIFVTWVRAVQDGEVRITSAGEIEKMIRIAADLDAEAQVRALIPEGVRSLDELQDLHEARVAAYEASTPAARGEVPVGLPPSAGADTGGDGADRGEEGPDADGGDAC